MTEKASLIPHALQRIALLVAVVVAATPPRVSAQPASTESVTLEQVAERRWRATYRLAGPTSALEFQRPADFYRERIWTVVTPGYAFDRDEDAQLLAVQSGGEPVDEIVVEFGEFTDPLPLEYELFVPFADGGRALYTGHLYASPDSGRMVRTLDLVPPPGESLIIRGGVHQGPLHWTDEYGDGTYAFFGDARPIETEVVIAVFDEGLPDWLRDEFDDWLPRLFDLYRERLGAALPWKPLVLYGHRPSDQEGFSYGGGTLTGLIQLTVTGDAWNEPSADGRATALGFLAHEVAHMWNGQLISNGGRDIWTHEGAADALADRLLLEFGVFDEAAHRGREETALNGCILRLGDGGIGDSDDPEVPYECGQVMAMWTVAAIGQGGDDTDLLEFWRALIASALGNDGEYDAERYFEVLASFGVTDEVTLAMRTAVAGTDGAAVEALVTGLRRAGLGLIQDDDSTPAYRYELARRAMGHLMGSACGGRFSYSGVQRFRTFPIEGCAPFEEALVIESIEGLEVASDGDRIYDQIVAACRSGDTVALRGPDSAVGVPCTVRMAPRRPWYSLAGG